MKINYKTIDRAKKLLAAEEGAVRKNWGGKLPIALIYANTYRVGMGSLGLHTLYRLFNARADVVCERVFFGEQQYPRPGDQLVSVESQQPLNQFPVLAFSISYELDYFNAVEMLRQAEIPVLAEARDDSHPLIIAGGPAVYANPEPLADIFDAFAIGEGEVIAPPLLEALWEATDMPRAEALRRLSEVAGLYVPALANGPVGRVWSRHLESAPAVTQIYTQNTEFGDRTLIEIARGCGRSCRYCLAGYGYRPMREIPLETVLALAQQGLQRRDRVGLVSAAVSDHSRIDEMAVALRRMGARLTAASMRVDPISEPLVRALAESGNQTLTIAPEAGSTRLRQVINKPQSDEQILRAAELAACYNFPQLKLYYMIGQPTEEEADIEAIAELTLAVKKCFPRNLTINATPYVPKAHTAFQWEAMAPAETIETRLGYLQRRLQPEGIEVRSDSTGWAAVEGTLARGDRRLGRALARMRRLSLKEWHKVLAAEGLSEADFVRARDRREALPWQVVDTGVSQSFFGWEAARADRSEGTPPCPPDHCMRCHVCDEDWAFNRQKSGFDLDRK